MGEGESVVLQFRVPQEWVVWLNEWVDTEKGKTQSVLLRDALGRWLKSRGYQVELPTEGR